MEPLAVEDFDIDEIRVAIARAERPTYFEFSNVLIEHSGALKAAGRERVARAITFLGDVCSMVLRPADTRMPLKPRVPAQKGWKRSYALEDIEEPQLDVLAGVLLRVPHRELRARIADVLWERRHDVQMAKAAIAAYLDELPTSADAYWQGDVARVHRALSLLKITNQKSELAATLARLESYVIGMMPGDGTPFSLALMDVMQGFSSKASAPRFVRLIDVATAAAQTAEGQKDWVRARHLWQIVGHWCRLQGDAEQHRAAKLRAAETLVSEAEGSIGQHMGYSRASSFLAEAIQDLRTVPQASERVKELHGRLLEYQASSMKELGQSSFPMDVSGIAADARKAVSDKGFEQALAALGELVDIPSLAALKAKVLERSQKSPLFYGITSVHVDPRTGRTVASRPGLKGGGAEEDEAVLLAHMRELATEIQCFCAASAIEPARLQIASDHLIDDSILERMVNRSALRMEGREGIVARGLVEGLRGDFLVATHLLVPQFEEWVRHLLNQVGVITSSIDADSNQQLVDLGKALFLPESDQIFGPDLAFNLQTLLVDRLGSNLRNRMAHGLLREGEFNSAQTRYFWALVLRLVVRTANVEST
jgi:hypothetical protein